MSYANNPWHPPTSVSTTSSTCNHLPVSTSSDLAIMLIEVRIVEYACGHRLQDRTKVYPPDIRGAELQNFKASAEECIHDSKLDHGNKILDHPDEINKIIDDFEKTCREKGIAPIHHVDEDEKPCGRGIASCR